jgi:hypothetical protein
MQYAHKCWFKLCYSVTSLQVANVKCATFLHTLSSVCCTNTHKMKTTYRNKRLFVYQTKCSQNAAKQITMTICCVISRFSHAWRQIGLSVCASTSITWDANSIHVVLHYVYIVTYFFRLPCSAVMYCNYLVRGPVFGGGGAYISYKICSDLMNKFFWSLFNTKRIQWNFKNSGKALRESK